MKKEFKDYHEAEKFISQFANQKKALFAKKIIKSPHLHFHGLDAKTMNQIMKEYSLLHGPLDHSYELTSLILHSNIDNLNNTQELISYLLNFITHVDNWAHIDTLITVPKIKKIPFETLYPMIKQTRDSHLEFVVRFYYVAFIMYRSRVELYNAFLATIKNSEQHYVIMAIAWVISELFLFQEYQILDFLASSPLSLKIKLTAIQKIKESKKTSALQKEKLELLKKRIIEESQNVTY